MLQEQYDFVDEPPQSIIESTGPPLCQQNTRNRSEKSDHPAAEHTHVFQVSQSPLQNILLQWKSFRIWEAHSSTLSNIMYNPADTVKSWTPRNVIAEFENVIPKLQSVIG